MEIMMCNGHTYNITLDTLIYMLRFKEYSIEVILPTMKFTIFNGQYILYSFYIKTSDPEQIIRECWLYNQPEYIIRQNNVF